MAGKGDKPRPLSVPVNVYGDNFDLIFRKKPKDKKSKKDKLDPRIDPTVPWDPKWDNQ